MDDYEKRSASLMLQENPWYAEGFQKALDHYDRKMKTGNTDNPQSIALAVEGYKAVLLAKSMLEAPSRKKLEIPGEK